MSFTIGSHTPSMGPRHAVHQFGEKAEGRAFDLRVIVRLLAYLRPYRGRMVAAFLLMMLASALTLAAPYLVKVAIDEPIAQGDLAGALLASLDLLPSHNHHLPSHAARQLQADINAIDYSLAAIYL